LRLGDGLADVAFLAMDLEHLGRPDLAHRFLDAYREHRDDVWPASLAHHHIAYRAQVRAKVTAIRSGQQGDAAALADGRRLLQLTSSHLESARVRLVLVGGLPGTGKSTVAEAIGRALEAPVLHSDHIRKELAGLSIDQHASASFGEGIYGEGIYTAAHTTLTYATMLERAAVGLEMGETLVLDATWSAPQWRDRARKAATSCHADLIELRCHAPRRVADQRIIDRALAGRGASDATPEIAAAMAAEERAWPEAAVIDTVQPIEQSIADAVGRVAQLPSLLPFV
ncbi:MAG: AAA family ATPase, partial [Acidimicrobiales bacterium]